MWIGTTTQLKFPALILPIKPASHQHIQIQPSSHFRVYCCDSNPSSNPRGFGSNSDDTNNVKKRPSSKDQKKATLLQQSKSAKRQSTSVADQAPGVSSKLDNKYNRITSDLQFEERLQAVKRSAVEKKKTEEKKEFGVIDYDAPVESKPDTIGLGTKVGVGIAVVVFGLVFALGDFLPSGSVTSNVEDGAVGKKLSKEETTALQSRLQQYEATLSSSPKDPAALEGAAVTLAELGEYARAATLLEDLAKEKPSDTEVFRLLGDIKYELKDYEASAAAYKNSMKVSKDIEFEGLRGLTNALLAAKKPDEAVQVLLETRESLNKGKLSDGDMKTQSGTAGSEVQSVDPIQVELLLGKAYSDWGHISDAVSVYDQLISSYPSDFRAYLAKGILLKLNGRVGDAERMFIQARFFAPEKAKALVDRYSRI